MKGLLKGETKNKKTKKKPTVKLEVLEQIRATAPKMLLFTRKLLYFVQILILFITINKEKQEAMQKKKVIL